MLPKISLITVCYNSEKTIEDTLKSVSVQTYPSIEYIIVDGRSTDSTNELISRYPGLVSKHISESDNGIYDAMNKGIRQATGDVIGFLNSDDILLEPDSITKMMRPFSEESLDIVYGDLYYVDPHDVSKIERDWSSGQFAKYKLNLGWMPAHPAFYARKILFDTLGEFDLKYKIAADYDLMVRFLKGSSESRICYLSEKVIAMRSGGQSNKDGIRTIYHSAKECIDSAYKNDLVIPEVSALLKIVRKISQYQFLLSTKRAIKLIS